MVRGCGVGGESGWAARGRLYIPSNSNVWSILGFKSASDRQAWRALEMSHYTRTDPYLPPSTLHGSHFLSCDFTWLAKLTLEKQTSQLSLAMQQCRDHSVRVWLLAGPIKWNRYLIQ